MTTEGLPAGMALLWVLVYDGFPTATSEPIEVEIPERGPTGSILHPRDGLMLMAEQPIQLWAAAAD